jgi:hypothetical protein
MQELRKIDRDKSLASAQFTIWEQWLPLYKVIGNGSTMLASQSSRGAVISTALYSKQYSTK